MQYWVANIVMLSTSLMNGEPQFIFKLFSILCEELGFVTEATTEYESQAKGQM